MACSRAVNWGLRSPNSNDNNAYYINTDGTVNNNNVYNANFAPRPALMEHRVQVPRPGESRGPSSKEAISVAASCMEDAASQDEHMVSTLTDPTPGKAPGHLYGGRCRQLSAMPSAPPHPNRVRMCNHDL